ncbi:MAG: F0F1 ATP synthase subunit alpha, partial [Treponema sp.]|nr:F0F1 ATP synthase subunit alpha [Treponema sp.]
SITDGQIFLDTELFNSGFRPAVDVGLSVSRVGGSAQTKAVRKLSGRLRLDLAQYREMAAFAQFGSDLDKATQDKLAQGQRLMEALKQPQFSPLAMEEQAAALFAAINGHLMDVPVDKVSDFVKGFLEYLRLRKADTLKKIADTGEVDSGSEQDLSGAIETFKRAKQ